MSKYDFCFRCGRNLHDALFGDAITTLKQEEASVE